MSRPWLVTGGAGFVGSHLVEVAHARGAASVRVLDDFSSGARSNLPSEGVEVFEGNVADRQLLARAAEGAAGVLHFAASVGVERVVGAPGATLRNNLASTLAVTELARSKRLPLVFASTSEVYGKSLAVPFREDADLVLGPTTTGRWSYAAGKATGEWLALDAGGVVVRLFNTVGPRQGGESGMVLPRFVAAAVAGGVLQVYGDGSQTRCFGQVRDVADGIWRLADGLCGGLLGDARVFNVGSAEEISILELAERVIAAAGGGRIERLPYEEAYGAGFEDMQRRVPDLERMAEVVGWQPSTRLDTTIAELVALARA